MALKDARSFFLLMRTLTKITQIKRVPRHRPQARQVPPSKKVSAIVAALCDYLSLHAERHSAWRDVYTHSTVVIQVLALILFFSLSLQLHYINSMCGARRTWKYWISLYKRHSIQLLFARWPQYVHLSFSFFIDMILLDIVYHCCDILELFIRKINYILLLWFVPISMFLDKLHFSTRDYICVLQWNSFRFAARSTQLIHKLLDITRVWC